MNMAVYFAVFETEKNVIQGVNAFYENWQHF